MKKKIMGIIAVVAIAVVTGYNIYISNNNHQRLPSLTLMNIEALANNDESSKYSCSASSKCYYGGREEGSVSCTGQVSCSRGYGYVTCDGNTSYC